MTFQNLVLVKDLDSLEESGESQKCLRKLVGLQIVLAFSACLLEVDILLGSLSPWRHESACEHLLVVGFCILALKSGLEAMSIGCQLLLCLQATSIQYYS